jgi:hypothetical protein
MQHTITHGEPFASVTVVAVLIEIGTAIGEMNNREADEYARSDSDMTCCSR